MARRLGNQRVAPLDGHQLLALVEAQVGQLVDLLPVALLVTTAAGTVLRANSAAAALLGPSALLIGRPIDELLRRRNVSVCVRTLRYQDEVVRLYVLQTAHDA